MTVNQETRQNHGFPNSCTDQTSTCDTSRFPHFSTSLSMVLKCQKCSRVDCWNSLKSSHCKKYTSYETQKSHCSRWRLCIVCCNEKFDRVILDLKIELYKASNNVIEALKLQKVGRHRSIYTLFHVSRIIFRELASKGSLTGINKTCW